MGIFESKPKEILNDEDFKNFITQTYVRPAYINDISDTLLWRQRWRRIGNYLLILSQITAICASILAFSESYFKIGYLSFISGCVSLLSIFFGQRADFSYKESEKRTNEANVILKSLSLKTVQDIIGDEIGGQSGTQSGTQSDKQSGIQSADNINTNSKEEINKPIDEATNKINKEENNEIIIDVK